MENATDKTFVKILGELVKVMKNQEKRNNENQEVWLEKQKVIFENDLITLANNRARVENTKNVEPKFAKIADAELKKLKKQYKKFL